MNRFLSYIIRTFQTYLIGGVSNIIFLIYLVYSDDYFYKLDFKIDDYSEKIKKYILFTYTIPIIIICLFSIFLFINQKSVKKRVDILISSILGVLLFVFFDRLLKRWLFLSENIIFSVFFELIIYLIVLIITLYFSNKFKEKS